MFYILIIGYMLSACSSSLPIWRHDAQVVYERVKVNGADKLLPAEFKNFEETLSKGESLMLDNESEEADKLFHLAWTEGKLLEMNLSVAKLHLAEAGRQKAEAAKRESQNAVKPEQLPLSRVDAEHTELTEIGLKSDKNRQQNEKTLPPSHTVMRGETLPQIAARSDVYNDQMLWPLIYRANRDQIRDPAHIWQGQILRIPRNLGRDEIAEARRYSQEKPIR
jgi:LysM repeat protein